MIDFIHRWAEPADLPALRALMTRAIDTLQSSFLAPDQVRASHKVMGLDTQLIEDRTYVLIEAPDGTIAGCGGWSFRATLYGGDDSIVTREPKRLDPARDAAKIRAMYTDPDFTRRGVGSLVLRTCEQAARDAGFTRAEMMATAAGVPLYEAARYAPVEAMSWADIDGVKVPLVRMQKNLT